MKLVIDTSILIDHLRGGSKWEDIIKSVDRDVEFYIPTIVIYEIFSGSSTKNDSMVEEIKALFKFFQKISLDEKVAKRAGELYRDVTKDLDAPDYVIAASALELGASLVTLNTKHFQKIPNLVLYTS